VNEGLKMGPKEMSLACFIFELHTSLWLVRETRDGNF
jgi:hypothetical protein